MKPLYKDLGEYIVYRDGRVFSKRKGIFLTPVIGKGKSKYLTVKVPHRISLHRLVAKLFNPNPNNLPEVNHLDGDKINNNDWNLKWSTRLENMQHAYATGLKDNRGDKCGRAKLKAIHVRVIREAVATRKFTNVSIANYFKINASSISDIKSGKSWASL